jgi:hypothetical protein
LVFSNFFLTSFAEKSLFTQIFATDLEALIHYAVPQARDKGFNVIPETRFDLPIYGAQQSTEGGYIRSRKTPSPIKGVVK